MYESITVENYRNAECENIKITIIHQTKEKNYCYTEVFKSILSAN